MDQTEKAKAKKRGRPGSDQPAGTKRQRKNGVHPADTEPPATKKKWQPPSGSWEDDIENIDACEEEGGGKLVVYLNWKNGQKTKHETSVIYKKCPQKVSQGYTLNLLCGDCDSLFLDASILRTACENYQGGKQIFGRK